MGEKLNPEEYARLEGLPDDEGKKFLSPFNETIEDIEVLAGHVLPKQLAKIKNTRHGVEADGDDFLELASKYERLRNSYEELFAQALSKKIDGLQTFIYQRKVILDSMAVWTQLIENGMMSNQEYYASAKTIVNQLEIINSILSRKLEG